MFFYTLWYLICQNWSIFPIDMNYLTFSFHFPNLQVLLLRAGPQVGPGRISGRCNARGGRPQNRPIPGVRPGPCPKEPASWPAQAGARPDTFPSRPASRPAKLGVQAGATGAAARRWSASIGGARGRGAKGDRKSVV